MILHFSILKPLLKIHNSKQSTTKGQIRFQRKNQYQFEKGDLPLHLPEFQNIRRRCEYCYKEGIDQKTSVKCTI